MKDVEIIATSLSPFNIACCSEILGHLISGRDSRMLQFLSHVFIDSLFLNSDLFQSFSKCIFVITTLDSKQCTRILFSCQPFFVEASQLVSVDSLAIYWLVCSLYNIFENLVAIEQSQIEAYEKILLGFLNRFSDQVTDVCVKILSLFLDRNYISSNLMICLWIKLAETLTEFAGGSIVTPKIVLRRSFFLFTLICRYLPLEKFTEHASTAKLFSKIHSAPSYAFDLLKPLLSHEDGSVKEFAHYALSNLYFDHPEYTIEKSVLEVIQEESSVDVIRTILKGLCVAFTSSIKSLKLQTDQVNPHSTDAEDSTSLLSTLSSSHLPLIKASMLSQDEDSQLYAVELFYIIFSNGLVHPSVVVPYYIFLETIQRPALHEAIASGLEMVRNRYSNYSSLSLKEGLALSFEYYSFATKGAPKGYVEFDNGFSCSVLQCYFDEIRKRKSKRHEFFRNVIGLLQSEDRKIVELTVVHTIS